MIHREKGSLRKIKMERTERQREREKHGSASTEMSCH